MEKDTILEVNDLEVNFYHDEGIVRANNCVSYRLQQGKSIGIVGESGCGKTVSTYAVLNILPPAGKIEGGEIKYRTNSGDVIDLAGLDSESKEMRNVRGNQISMIFQEPMTAFSPVHTIYNQISEAILLHRDISKEEARERVVNLLDRVGIANAGKRVDDYPFQFSGGMRQRAMIAMALACNPRILIADEPTTALDVTIQAQVLNLIQEMQDEFDLSLVLITHDLGVIAHMVDEVFVMYLGRIVERGPVRDIYKNPLHPYTRDLLRSIPRPGAGKEEISSIKGSVPDSYTLPSGCSFHPRCSDFSGATCRKKIPVEKEIEAGHYVSCHKYAGKGSGRE